MFSSCQNASKWSVYANTLLFSLLERRRMPVERRANHIGIRTSNADVCLNDPNGLCKALTTSYPDDSAIQTNPFLSILSMRGTNTLVISASPNSRLMTPGSQPLRTLRSNTTLSPLIGTASYVEKKGAIARCRCGRTAFSGNPSGRRECSCWRGRKTRSG